MSNPPELTQDLDQPPGYVPMITKVTREQLLFLINDFFDSSHQIPPNADISIKLPDYCGGSITIEKDCCIEIRWKGHYP